VSVGLQDTTPFGCKVVPYINQDGNRWSDPIEIDGTSPMTNREGIRPLFQQVLE